MFVIFNATPLVAGRTILHTIITSLERIAFNGDPLQFLLVETTYQPFISLFHQTDIVKNHPELTGVRKFIQLPFLVASNTYHSQLRFRPYH